MSYLNTNYLVAIPGYPFMMLDYGHLIGPNRNIPVSPSDATKKKDGTILFADQVQFEEIVHSLEAV